MSCRQHENDRFGHHGDLQRHRFGDNSIGARTQSSPIAGPQPDHYGDEHLRTQRGVDAEATQRSSRAKAIVRPGRA